jgi:hypothetical protein
MPDAPQRERRALTWNQVTAIAANLIVGVLAKRTLRRQQTFLELFRDRHRRRKVARLPTQAKCRSSGSSFCLTRFAPQ